MCHVRVFLALKSCPNISNPVPYHLQLDGLQLKGPTFAWTKSKGVNNDIWLAAFLSPHFGGQNSKCLIKCFIFHFRSKNFDFQISSFNNNIETNTFQEWKHSSVDVDIF